MSVNWSLYEKKLNLNGINIRERQINLLKEFIINDFDTNPSFRSAYMNDSTTVTDIHVINGKDAYTKTVLMQPEDEINVGDVFTFDNNKWLCVEADKTNPVNQQGIVNLCNNTLKVYKNSNLFIIPCIFSDKNINMDEGKFINLASGHYLITVPNGVITKSDLNLRFILNDSAYKVFGINNSNNGLIKIEIVDDNFIPDDNRDLGIANYFSNQHEEVISSITLTPSDDTLCLGRSLELTAHYFNNGVEDLTKYFLYTITNVDESDNEYITKQVLANKCILTANNISVYAGKHINVHVALLGVPSVYYERDIKLVSF